MYVICHIYGIYISLCVIVYRHNYGNTITYPYKCNCGYMYIYMFIFMEIGFYVYEHVYM